jgi:2-succinyl-5-enolpyruvyl-6-hydroxy-3-cyclohexene-1-carboxylate synthase
MSFENRNYAFAGAFVDELVRAGLRYVCICPGSRSSPIAIAFARNKRVQIWSHLDERSAAFFALGMAQALDQPVAMLCSSGTAAANFYPAVIEAHYSATPLVVITADRPPELWEWGAPQTMDQTRMYGPHAKWSVAAPTPEVTPALLRYVRFLAARVYSTAIETPAGPVHVNMPFRDPLAQEQVPDDLRLLETTHAPEAWVGRDQGEPYARVSAERAVPDMNTVRQLAGELSHTKRGIIVCGWQRSPEFPRLVTALAKRLGYPVLADPLSQVRAGQHDLTAVIDNYDLFIREPELADSLAPTVVVRFGAVPTSKPLTQFLEQNRNARQVLVSHGAWSDPSHLSTDVIRSEASALCQALTDELTPAERPNAWLDRWLVARDLADLAVDGQLQAMDEMFEGKVFTELAKLLPQDAWLMAGNSMPVRDMDSFLPRTAKRIRCLANRGVNGIDGVVSTALGHAATGQSRLALVIGDVSFYHDLNGLLAAQRYGMDATIVVINNDGGGIFSFLPQAEHPEYFEELLGTPHGLQFEPVAKLYGLTYAKVSSWNEFRSAVSNSLRTPGTAIVEVPGDRARNVQLHRQVTDAVLSSARRAAVA